MHNLVQFGIHKQVVARLLLPMIGRMASRICKEQRSFIDVTLEKIFINLLENWELEESHLVKDLKELKNKVESEKVSSPNRMKINSYYMTWAKFFKRALHAGIGNPYIVLDQTQVKNFARLYDKKIDKLYKDHATRMLWDELSEKHRIDCIEFKQIDSVEKCRLWMSEENNERWFRNIQSLNLSNRYLRVIPEEIKLLTGLKRLNLSGNQIKSIPEQFEEMSNLEDLYFNRNQIQSVPVFIQGLPRLENLFLQYNQIQSVPDVIIIGDPHLKLFLHGNPNLSIPEGREGELRLKKFNNFQGKLEEYSIIKFKEYSIIVDRVEFYDTGPKQSESLKDLVTRIKLAKII